MRTRQAAPVLALALTATFGLGACSSSPAQNAAAACDALQEYTTSLDTLAQSIKPDATVDEVRTARDAVADSEKKLEDALSSVKVDRVDEVKDAWGQLKDELSGLDSDASLTSAVDSLKAKTKNLQDARADLSKSLNCS